MPNPIGGGEHCDPLILKHDLINHLVSQEMPELDSGLEVAEGLEDGAGYFDGEGDKGVAVLPTPDGVWHRDSHYWRKFIGGAHKKLLKIQIFIRNLL